MNQTDIEQARFNMIEQQVRPWDVLDPQVLDTMNAVPREAVCPGDATVHWPSPTPASRSAMTRS